MLPQQPSIHNWFYPFPFIFKWTCYPKYLNQFFFYANIQKIWSSLHLRRIHYIIKEQRRVLSKMRRGDKVHCTPTPTSSQASSPSTVAFIHLVNNGSGVCVWATGASGQWECNDNDDNGLLWCHHVVFIIVSSLIIILSQFGVTVLRLIAHVILVNKLFCFNHEIIRVLKYSFSQDCIYQQVPCS